MHATRYQLAPLALVIASLTCPLAGAQPVAGQPNTQVIRHVGGQAVERAVTPLLSVEFAGGTLGQFVDAVKGATTETINVVVPADAMVLAVPRLSLKNVSPFMALQSLEYINQRVALAPSGPHMSPGMSNFSEITVQDLNQSDRSPFESARTFAIVYTKRDRAVQQYGLEIPGLTQTTQVFTVRDLLPTEGPNALPGLSLDEIISPLEKTLSVEAGSEGADATGTPAKLMVHKESNLIIIKGTSRQTALVKQVLERLKEDVDRTRASVLSERDRLQFVEELRRQNQVRQQALQEQLKKAQVRADDLHNAIERATSDKNERAMTEAKSGLALVEASMSSLAAQLERSVLDQSEVEYEAARQWRSMQMGNAGAELRALRDQVEQLRKQLEQTKVTAPSAGTR